MTAASAPGRSARRPVFDLRGLEVGLASAEAALGRAVDHLRDGGLIAYPTETVYGFGGGCSPATVAALAALKRRDRHSPFLLLVDPRQMPPGLRWTPEARELARAFWPGALTLVLADPEKTFPPGIRGATGVAVRHTAHSIAAALVEALGEPLTSTSANAPASPPATDADEVAEALRALGAGPDVPILDGGALPPSPPSTVVDCSGPVPLLVREGAIPLSRLRCVIPDLTTHG